MKKELMNEFEVRYMKKLKDEGWVEVDDVLTNLFEKFVIDLKGYPTVRLVERGKDDKCFYGLSRAWLTIKEGN